MFRKFTFMIIIPALLALGAGMAAGWAMQPSGHTDTKLDAMIAIHEPSTGMQPFSSGEKTVMNRCAKKWKGVIHKVRIDLESAGRNTPDQNKLNCSIVVNSPENLIVVARRIQAERSALASGITAVMDRAGEALCARKTYGPQCEGIKKIYI